jgi:catalase
MERDDLVFNLVTALSECDKVVQEKMVWHFSRCDDEFGRRLAEGLGLDNTTARG